MILKSEALMEIELKRQYERGVAEGKLMILTMLRELEEKEKRENEEKENGSERR